ncbi:MAG: putative transport system permease protein [Clostridia bacterium]|nr:putative transport system permease protein [Clostridia bacterium]
MGAAYLKHGDEAIVSSGVGARELRIDTIAVLDLLRRKGKTLLLLLIIVLAAGTAVTLYLVTAAMQEELANTFDEIGANIVVLPADDGSFSYGGVTIPAVREVAPLTNDDVIAINTIPHRQNIAYVAPKVLGLTKVEGKQVMLVGIDFPSELQLKKWWRWEGQKPTGSSDLLLGSKAASDLGLGPGDDFSLKGQRFRVNAVLKEQGTEEDGLIFGQLLNVQKFFGRENQLNFIEVAAYCNTCPIQTIAREIQDRLPHARVKIMAEAILARQQMVDRFTAFAYAAAAVVVLIGTLLIFLNMMSTVNEKTKEIGIYRAFGFRKGNVFEIFITQALLLGMLGGGLAFVVGTMAARIIGPGLAKMSIQIAWNPWLFGLATGGAMALTVLACIYPAHRAANLDPVEALWSI